VRGGDDGLFYLGAGPLAALLLGALLVPLRDATVASNFTFAFLALTIAVGELGGRLPALATAVVSALSLNFFLTRPYLTLTIHGRDDVIAFLGLAACGLLAAALGSPRRERHAAARELVLLHDALRESAAAGPAGAALQRLLDAARSTFPLAAIAVRDASGALLTRSGSEGPAPAAVAGVAALATATEGGEWRLGAPLPPSGIRVPLVVAARTVGWADLWGDGRPAGNDSRRALEALVSAVAVLVDARTRASGAAVPPASAWRVGAGRP
jgi:two-component system sensor histidine kinase KdpD